LIGDEKGVCLAYTLGKTMVPVILPVMTGTVFSAVLKCTNARIVPWKKALHKRWSSTVVRRCGRTGVRAARIQRRSPVPASDRSGRRRSEVKGGHMADVQSPRSPFGA
jgi:hypothetical protein